MATIFSAISKGIASGQEFAQARVQTQLQRERLEFERQKVQQFKVAQGLKLGEMRMDTIQKSLRKTPKVAKAMMTSFNKQMEKAGFQDMLIGDVEQAAILEQEGRSARLNAVNELSKKFIFTGDDQRDKATLETLDKASKFMDEGEYQELLKFFVKEEADVQAQQARLAQQQQKFQQTQTAQESRFQRGQQLKIRQKLENDVRNIEKIHAESGEIYKRINSDFELFKKKAIDEGTFEANLVKSFIRLTESRISDNDVNFLAGSGSAWQNVKERFKRLKNPTRVPNSIRNSLINLSRKSVRLGDRKLVSELQPALKRIRGNKFNPSEFLSNTSLRLIRGRGQKRKAAPTQRKRGLNDFVNALNANRKKSGKSPLSRKEIQNLERKLRQQGRI